MRIPKEKPDSRPHRLPVARAERPKGPNDCRAGALISLEQAWEGETGPFRNRKLLRFRSDGGHGSKQDYQEDDYVVLHCSRKASGTEYLKVTFRWHTRFSVCRRKFMHAGPVRLAFYNGKYPSS